VHRAHLADEARPEAGEDARGACYAYAYPEPDGFAGWPVRPDQARYDSALGEFLLPYEAVRTAADPAATLLDFLQDTYEAAAVLGGWDRAALEAGSADVEPQRQPVGGGR